MAEDPEDSSLELWLNMTALIKWQLLIKGIKKRSQNLKRYKETAPQHRIIHVFKCKFKQNI